MIQRGRLNERAPHTKHGKETAFKACLDGSNEKGKLAASAQENLAGNRVGFRRDLG